MDFFGRQVATRQLSRRLLLLFALSVLAIVVAVNAVILFVVRVLQPEIDGTIPFDSAWLSQQSGTLFWTTLVVFGVIGIASLYKTAMLSQGGGAVARSLGGEQVNADTADPLRRRLLNVVEEMAIASGVPMPQVYVLEHEAGINAFAAGHNPANAAIAVTRGALTQLDRSELQGVIAHEFSHILNGDMRLNIRMMGLLFGLLAIALIARLVLRHAPRSGGGRKGGGGLAVILMAALAVMVLGYLGLFLGRLIQAAVSRSRESLADASAVQFTRDPVGLRGALVKIGAAEAGSRLVDADAEEVAHMLFASGMRRLLATHPPLVQRIRSLDPAFDPREFDTTRAQMLAAEVNKVAPESVGDSAAGRLAGLVTSAVLVAPAAIARLVGNPGTIHVQLAQALRNSLPDGIRSAVQDPEQAQALLLAFAVDVGAVRMHQLRIVEERLGQGVVRAVEGWLPEVARLEPMQRLPAFMGLFPAIHRFARNEKENLTACFKALLHDDRRESLSAYVLAKLAEVQLSDELKPREKGGDRTLDAVREELQVLFSVLAKHGNQEEKSARQAYEMGMHHLLPRDRPAYDFPRTWPARLDAALAKLDELRSPAKEQLVEALVKTISHDLKLTIGESELLRMVCAVLHCPLPPLLAQEAVVVSD